jgi:hypothetical protein
MPTKGFFRSLFDFSFTSMVTTKVIKVTYVISLVIIVLAVLGGTAAAVKLSPALVVLAPMAAFALAVGVRMALEAVAALFRLVDTNAELVWLKRQELGIVDDGDSAAATRSPAEPVQYQVGDVVNGHRFNGEAWVPVAS